MWSRLWAWAVDSEGSSRSSALIRIGLAMLIWSRWAAESAPFYSPDAIRPLLALALYASSGLMFLGLWTGFAVPATAAVTAGMYAYGVHTHHAWAAHHTYVLVFAIVYCALTPCGRSYSVDRWLAVRRARKLGLAPRPERGNLLGLRRMALQLAVMYFFTAADKTHWDYFSGARIEKLLMKYHFGSTYPDWPGFHELCVVLGVMTVVLEYSLAFGLFLPRARRILVPAGVLFHVGLYYALPVSTFSLTVILLYLAYFDPDAAHRTLDEIQASGEQPAAS